MDEVEQEVILFARKYDEAKTWWGKSDWFWFWSTVEEVIELGLSLLHLHRHPPDYEIKQIASISLNYLRKRRRR